MRRLFPIAVTLSLIVAPALGVIRVRQSGTGARYLGSFPGMRLGFQRDGEKYVARGANFVLSVSASESRLRYFEGFGDVDHWFRDEEVRIQLVGASFLNGQPLEDQRYDFVAFRQVYPRINLEFGGTGGQLEYRFAAGSGADPSVIRIRITGASKLRVEPDGSLRARTPIGEVSVPIPVAQDAFDGEWRTVQGRFVLLRNGLAEFRTRPN